MSVGTISPRAFRRRERSVLAPSWLSSNRAWKTPQVGVIYPVVCGIPVYMVYIVYESRININRWRKNNHNSSSSEGCKKYWWNIARHGKYCTRYLVADYHLPGYSTKLFAGRGRPSTLVGMGWGCLVGPAGVQNGFRLQWRVSWYPRFPL